MSMTDPLIGKRLGDYLIEGVLGTGGMARVYRGYDDNLDRYAAIKVIEPQLIASAEEDEYRERFLREARAIARLSHVRIVGVYQFNQIGNLYYIAMEYVEGRNLRDILKGYINQDKLMPTEELLLVLRDMADALDYAHKQHIIHRDVKPSNIIVTDEGHGVLTDFGLALNAVEGTIGNTFGSVHYIAPEQAISSAQAVPQSDQYSLGIVAYELLTGRVPFDDASAMSVALKHISDPPPPPTELNPNIPPEVEQALLKALDKDISKRYTTASDFVHALEIVFEALGNQDISPAAGSLPSGPPAPTSPVPPPEFEEQAQRLRDIKAKMDKDANDSVAARPSSVSTPLAIKNGMPRWVLIGGAAVVIILLIGAALFLSGALGPDVEATETAQAAVLLQTDTQVARQSQTAVALVTQAEATVLAQSTSVAATTFSQETNAAATAMAQETRVAATQFAAATATKLAEPTNTLVPPTPTNTPVPPTNTNTPVPPTATNIPTRTNTPLPTATPTPELFIASETDTQQVLLRYDGRLLVIGNRDRASAINVDDLVFVLFEPDDDGNIRRVRSFDVGQQFDDTTRNMRPGRCFEVLDSREFSSLPSSNPLASNLCSRTPFWVTMTSPFWVSDSRDAYFEARLGPVDKIGECPANRPQTRSELRCAIDLNAVP